MNIETLDIPCQSNKDLFMDTLLRDRGITKDMKKSTPGGSQTNDFLITMSALYHCATNSAQ